MTGSVITGRGVTDIPRAGDPDDECQAYDDEDDLVCTREQGHDVDRGRP